MRDDGPVDVLPPLRADVLRRALLPPAGPVPRLEVVGETGSTNDDVLAGVRDDPSAWPDGALLLAEHQSGGRGRLGRTWTAPARTSLTGTFVVRPGAAASGVGWLPLVVGLGVVRALRTDGGVQAWSKWPNDVLVAGPGRAAGPDGPRKVAGILVQATPDGQAVVVGVGLNVAQQVGQLPVATATSLALAGGSTDRQALVVALARELAQVVGRWRSWAGDAVGAGLADEVAQVCATLGRPVRVELPGATTLTGQAVRLDSDGALVVAGSGGQHRVLAGDVVHLRGARSG